MTICEPGVAGPFSFIPATSEVGSCQDFINGTGAASYSYITLYITESGPLSLLIDGNSGTGFIDVSIFNIPSGQDPCDAILDVNNEIGCNYATAANGCNQFGTEFPCTSSVPSPFVNAGDVLMILVEDWSSAQTTFTMELGDPPNAQTGPPDATIDPSGPFTADQSIATVNAFNSGGTWSADCGGCIDPDSGNFSPSLAGPGTWNICYDLGVAPCEDSDCIEVLVLPSSGGGGDCDSEFVDSGGDNGDYFNNENATWVYCSGTPDQDVTLEFIEFELEDVWDFITIYAGPDNTYPNLGDYTGTTSQEPCFRRMAA